VISRNMEVGQTVQASFTAPKLFEIANDLSKMQVECQIDEADVGKVKEGQKVRFTVDAFPDDVFNGTVSQVRYSPTINQNVVTYTTIVNFENPEGKLRPGMTAAVSVITGEAKGALRIPNSALRFTPELPAEKIAEIMKAAGERLLSQRQGEGGRKIPAVNETQPGGRQPSKAWFLDDRGMLNVALIRPGITDNAFTEILIGDLKEGQKVITGLGSGQEDASSEQLGPGPGAPNPIMFMSPPPPPPPG
jgi:HlyD family secretion protein